MRRTTIPGNGEVQLEEILSRVSSEDSLQEDQALLMEEDVWLPDSDPPTLQEIIHDAPMEKAMTSQGITKDYLAGMLKEALEAHKTQLFFDQRTGEIKYSRDLVHWRVREEARRDAHKLLSHYPPDRQELIGGPTGYIPIQAGPQIQAIIRDLTLNVLGGPDPGNEAVVSE